ncbi:MAG: NAD(P)-binding domain-containing protein [Candidatus Korarchaeum sp.]
MAPFLLDVAVMGLGKVGTSLVLGLSRMGYRVLASTANPERHKDIEAMGIEILPSFEAARRSEIVVIAVKPKQVRGLAEEIRGAVEADLLPALKREGSGEVWSYIPGPHWVQPRARS